MTAGGFLRLRGAAKKPTSPEREQVDKRPSFVDQFKHLQQRVDVLLGGDRIAGDDSGDMGRIRQLLGLLSRGKRSPQVDHRLLDRRDGFQVLQND